MISSGFTRLQADHYCYAKWFENFFIILLLYVDDMLIGRSSMKEIVNLKAKLAKEFSMKDMGPRKKFLEWKSAERKEVAGDITSWVHGKVLKRFNMSDVKPVNVPLRGHFKLSKTQAPTTEDEKAFMSEVPYVSVVAAWCILWSVRGQILLNQWALSAGIWTILGRSIGEP